MGKGPWDCIIRCVCKQEAGGGLRWGQTSGQNSGGTGRAQALQAGVWWTEGQGKEALGRAAVCMRVPRLPTGSEPTVCPKLGRSGPWGLSG